MKLKSLLLFMIILSSSVPLSFAEESKTIIEEQNFFVEYDLPSKNSKKAPSLLPISIIKGLSISLLLA